MDIWVEMVVTSLLPIQLFFVQTGVTYNVQSLHGTWISRVGITWDTCCHGDIYLGGVRTVFVELSTALGIYRNHKFYR